MVVFRHQIQQRHHYIDQVLFRFTRKDLPPRFQMCRAAKIAETVACPPRSSARIVANGKQRPSNGQQMLIGVEECVECLGPF
ncbi:hypothetical protein ACS73_19030 [Pseudomonas lini]|nr:hypothetical protein ACS73_19030 [Pseudomonas lini]